MEFMSGAEEALYTDSLVSAGKSADPSDLMFFYLCNNTPVHKCLLIPYNPIKLRFSLLIVPCSLLWSLNFRLY